MKSSGIVLDMKRYYSPDDTAPPAATWYDTSRFGTDGTITTATWARQASGLYALDFNSATPDYVEVTCPQCNFTSEDFSVVGRVKIDSLATYRTVFCRGVVNADGYYWLIYPTGVIQFLTSQSAALQSTVTATGAVTTGVNYTLGVTRSGTSVLLYVNGELPTQTPASHTNPLTSARTGKVGIQDNKSTYPFDGLISHLTVYSRALSAGEHKNIHESLVRYG